MKMKKEELMNGNIVATRDGYLGVVIKYGDGSDDGYILYQEIGMDDLMLFNDDLTCEDGEDWDIMEVFGYHSGTYSFYEIETGNPMPDWSREPDWQRPTPKEREARAAEFERQRLQRIEEWRQQEEERRKLAEERRKDCISIITQAFYGNRTGTEIRRDDVKSFIRGNLSPRPGDDFSDVELRTIPVPSDENIVIVYDQTREDEYLHSDLARMAEERFKEFGEYPYYYITCSIPELGVELHTRCFACRIDENGVFQSLEDGDGEKFIDYFPLR